MTESGGYGNQPLVNGGAALGVRETAEQPLEIALSNALRDRELLLVLDNCEHLLDACAQLVDGLLRACPGVRVLATSREPIGIGGETAWRVPSLPVPKAQLATAPEHLLEYPAVQLFVQRATAAQPRFAFTARNAASVVQICRRLDGIPLALELAAARVEALTAEQVAQRLDQRFRLLTGGSRAALPRQQTLSATLEWSYGLLTSNERRLFERLAVFAGGWMLEAAEAVCAGQGVTVDDVLDLLAALTRKSLVIAEETVDGTERYLLPETVRDYARQKLGARGVREITALRQRHADFYGALVEQLPDRVSDSDIAPLAFRSDSVRRADAEHDNLRVMLGWWLESGRVAPGLRVARRLTGWWMIRGLYGEGRQWLTAQIELDERTAQDGTSRADEVSPVDRAFALGAIGLFTSRQGDYQESHARYEASAVIWRELGDTAALGVCLSWLGLNAWCSDASSQAVEQLEESRRLLAQCDPSPRTASAVAMNFRNLGIVARWQGHHTRAAEYFRASLDSARLMLATGGYTVARGLCHLGRTVFLQGDHAESKRLFREALEDGTRHASWPRITGRSACMGISLGASRDSRGT